eukprot:14805863-Alexandrium_andersonii.AAC.1
MLPDARPVDRESHVKVIATTCGRSGAQASSAATSSTGSTGSTRQALAQLGAPLRWAQLFKSIAGRVRSPCDEPLEVGSAAIPCAVVET